MNYYTEPELYMYVLIPLTGEWVRYTFPPVLVYVEIGANLYEIK